MKSAAFFGVVVAIAFAQETPPPRSAAIDLWDRGTVAFGVFVPEEAAARAAAYANPLYDFLFLNLEQRYDADVVRTVAEGLQASRAARGRPRKTLIVRIPPVERDGPVATKARITDVYALGGDGVTVPHVRSADEAARLLWFFLDTGVSIWSPANRQGHKLAMLMIEDPGAAAQADQIAGLKGYSILACGIGSLTRALGGDRDAAEAANQKILAATKRENLVNMLTATSRDIEQRVRQGYLALIAMGPDADEAIRIGRRAAGRPADSAAAAQ